MSTPEKEASSAAGPTPITPPPCKSKRQWCDDLRRRTPPPPPRLSERTPPRPLVKSIGVAAVSVTPDTYPESEAVSSRKALLRHPHADRPSAGRRLDYDKEEKPHHRRNSSWSLGGDLEPPRSNLPARLLWASCMATLIGALIFLLGYQRGLSDELRGSGGGAGASSSTAAVADSLIGSSSAAAVAGMSSSSALSSSSSPPRAFVCITGQLPRLELQNKIDRLFRPLRDEYGVAVDVALVLSDSDHASNKHTKEHEDQEFFAMKEVVDTLTPFADRVLNDELDVQSANPLIPPAYLDQLGKKDRMAPDEQEERVRNHLRQFETLSKCHYHMAKSRREYDVVHRIRDDTGYYERVNFTEIQTVIAQDSMTMITSACSQHGGINDRGAFVSYDAAYDYFNHPILHMYTQPIVEEIDNTEKFLSITYARTVRNMVVLPDLYLLKFIMPGTESGDGSGDGKKGFYHKSDRECISKHGLKKPL